MRKTAKKGFTIVELVIVIAVIAVLAAVLIPTFVSLVNKANNSADTQMIANINKYLAAVENTDGRNASIVDAMKDAADAGYNAAALANATNDIYWDSKIDRFLAVDGKKTVAGPDGVKFSADADKVANYWIVSTEPNGTYATCLTGKLADNKVTTKVSLDLTNYRSIDIEVTADAEGIHLYGVIHTLNANGKNPTVHGYVYKLEGSVKADNAVFHDEDTTNITGAHSINCYDADGNKVCDFCNNEPTDRFACQHTNMVAGTSEGATCTSMGYTSKKCETCGYTEIETTKALGHIWNDGKVTAEATCNATGVKTYTCNREGCGETKTETLAMTEHTYGEATVMKDATCTEAGLKTYTCSVCDGTKNETIPVDKDAHPEDKIVEVKATVTCTAAGKTAGKKCEDCGTVTEGCEDKKALGHDMKDVPKQEATCVATGYSAHKQCSRCDHTEGKTVYPKDTTDGHNWSETGTSITDKKATCSAMGWSNHQCLNEGCNESKEMQDVERDANNHSNQTTIGKQEPTCITAGWEEYEYCTGCKKVIGQKTTIPATGVHTFSKLASDGYKCENCTACREKVTISNDILTEDIERIKESENNTTIIPSEWSARADMIVFGFAEDYESGIVNGGKEYAKYTTSSDGVYIYAVKIDNYRDYTLGEKKNDKDDYLLEIYVLSDKVMCYSGNGQFFSSYGINYMEYVDLGNEKDNGNYSAFKGAVREVRMENFDTTAATDLSGMFSYCYIETLTLGMNMTTGKITATDPIFDDACYGKVTIQNTKWTVEPDSELICGESDSIVPNDHWPSYYKQ